MSDRAIGPSEIERCLASARRTWRLERFARGALVVLLFAASATVAAFAVDNLLHLSLPLRWAVAVGLAAGGVYLTVRRVLAPMLERLNDWMVAVHIERHAEDLDNRLINAVQFRDEDVPQGSRGFRDMQLADAAEAAAHVEVAHTVNRHGLVRLAIAAGCALVAVCLYRGFLPRHFRNAAGRYFQLSTFVAPITRTHLAVAPGDVRVFAGDDLVVEATTTGAVPRSARIEYRAEDEDAGSVAQMSFSGDAFVHTLRNITRGLRYRVRAGDAASREFRVTVATRPVLEEIEVTYQYPEYIGIDDLVIPGASGDVTTVKGARVTVTLRADRPLAAGTFRPPSGNSQPVTVLADGRVAGSFLVAESGRYRMTFEDADGIPGKEPVVRPVTARDDAPPKVAVVSPGKDIEAMADEKVTVNIAATDDFGVRVVTLAAGLEGANEPATIGARRFDPGTRQVQDGFVLDLAALDAKAGQTVRYSASADDGRGEPDGIGSSPFYVIRVIDAETIEKRLAALTADVISRLEDILARQKRARTTLSDLRFAAASEIVAGLARLADTQQAIRHDTEGAAQDCEKLPGFDPAAIELRRLLANEMLSVIRLLDAAAAVAASDGGEVSVEEPYSLQAVIIRKLQDVIDALRAMAAGDETALRKLARGDEEEAESDDAAEVVADALEALEAFVEDQRKIIEQTKRLEEKMGEDFSEADQEMLDNLAQAEMEWAKTIKEAFADLSRLPEQDFTDSTQADEFVEVYAEVHRAAEALNRKNVEIAVPLEQAGLELAEQLTANLEKWLPDVHDTQKWVMEEPIEEYDVPMVELPDELEDLVGDLIDDLDEMGDDVEDVSSGWMDSLDKGAGWDVADGPISNMSAQGKTGNRMPNSQEVGGRSGEGRTGKSSGQFVEKTATGKGGRPTPTRLTDDPWEAGRVEDSSPEMTGGATGGGKQSGSGAEGLLGYLPEELDQRLGRLVGRQLGIINKAQRLDEGLQAVRYPTTGLGNTIDIMKEALADIANARFADYSRRHKVVVGDLSDLQHVVAQQKTINRDRSARVPKRLREEIATAMQEETPEDYHDLVGAYYRVLSNWR